MANEFDIVYIVILYCDTTLSISLFNPGQYLVSLARCFVHAIPWCDSCSWFKALLCIWADINK